MPVLIRNALLIAALPGAFLLLFAATGQPIPPGHWQWMDIASEGGTALLAALWCLIVLGSRPDGRVTRLLAGGLGCIMLGSWADCLDELFSVPHDAFWDNVLESLLPLGMLVLTLGLVYWRREQATLSDHMRKRERLFRSHRPYDALTQLADAAYLRAQLRLEREKGDKTSALVLLDIDGFHCVNREHGPVEGDRVLQAISHMLLLNLRNEDLLCRYAGDRFAVLMPGLTVPQAREAAQHLCSMVFAMRHHAARGRVQLTLRYCCAPTGGAPDRLLAELCRQIDSA